MPPCYLFHIFFVLSWQKLRCEKCTKTLCFPILFEHRPFQLQGQIILNFRCKRLRNKPSFQGSCGHWFLVNVSMILGSCWGPKSLQNDGRNKLGTWLGKKKGVQDRLGTPQGASWSSKTPQEADLGPKRPQLGLPKRVPPKVFGPPKSALAPRGLPRPIFHRF